MCDFSTGLTNRILDVYRSFRQPPDIILARRGDDISVDPPLSARTEVIPLPIVGLNQEFRSQNRTPNFANRFAAISCAIGYLLYSLVLYFKMQRSSKTIRLVHAQFIFPHGLFGLLLARLSRVPLIVTAQGQDVSVQMRNSILLRVASLIVLRRANLTIAVSKPIQRILRQFGVSSIYLPNSVDTASIRPHRRLNNENSILFVGTMIERKQPLLLLRAFEIIADQVPAATLVMCGDGPLEDCLRKEVEKKGLQKRVKLLSYASEPTLMDLRSRAGIFVLPSLSEGTSLALLEAMAAGQAVIVSRNESHAAILEHRVNGLFFEVGNAEELAKQILLVMADKELRSRMSKSARHLCETQFSNAIVAKQLEDLYLTALAGSTAELEFRNDPCSDGTLADVKSRRIQIDIRRLFCDSSMFRADSLERVYTGACAGF